MWRPLRRCAGAAFCLQLRRRTIASLCVLQIEGRAREHGMHSSNRMHQRYSSNALWHGAAQAFAAAQLVGSERAAEREAVHAAALAEATAHWEARLAAEEDRLAGAEAAAAAAAAAAELGARAAAGEAARAAPARPPPPPPPRPPTRAWPRRPRARRPRPPRGGAASASATRWEP